ncbi:MAG TPA: hypothetical protein PL048_14470 [Leptospiraceae bacterium]|nr:hypothetical protein [Leptospiraceae bacterium]HMY65456.1 hypothetical protein [Leptospiraceae bacterium]HMZ59979.1 hypothetical protein [Leptospiraceae bacterium]HNF14303.1 hypothetical protein [Leptospiraceae bacterium]HNF23543.1 hypothetical protein [Leptospiraceae bacterium]
MKCGNCGGSVDLTDAVCGYCGQSLPVSVMSEESRIILSDFLQSMEKILQANNNKYDPTIFIAFIMLVGFWGFATFRMTRFSGNPFFIGIASAVLGMFLFVSWGFVISHMRQKSHTFAYENQVKGEIEIFLNRTGMTWQDFRQESMKILTDDSALYKIIVRVN